MQVPIISGIYADNVGGVRTAYPVNRIPVPIKSGISSGYLRPGYGLIQDGTGPGVDRGGIEWRGALYRVMGPSLVRIAADGSHAVLGSIAGSGQCSFDYSFDRLAIGGGGVLHYWDGSTLTTVSDPDLGPVVDMVWVDGYFMTTDGEFLVVTELSDPTSVNPLKYGSSEIDPDEVTGLLKIRGEVYALNRHTIEVFTNVGGDNFPFSRVEGAQIQKGAIGPHAKCVYLDAVAFVGSGRNEPPSVYIGGSGGTQKIATQEIDKVLSTYTEEQLAACVVEAVQDGSHNHLYIHLPDRCLVYDHSASQAVGELVWFVLTSATEGFATYRARNHVWCYDRWNVGDPTSTKHGHMTDAVSSHWGDVVRWEFGTAILYNDGRGAVIHNIELVALTGHVSITDTPTISTSHSVDGETWSTERYISAGKAGERAKRILWLQGGMIRNWRIQRFKGDSRAHLSIMRIDMQAEPLVY